MNEVKLNRSKIAGLVIIAASLLLLGIWELWARESLMYDRVLVLKSPLDGNVALTAKLLREKRVEKAPAGALKVGDENQIIGKETGHYIPAGTELFKEYFQESSFQVGGTTGKFILSIPDTWLMSYPQTMKRGDRAFFYCGGEIVTDAVVAYVRDGTNQEVVYEGQGRFNSSAKVSLIEVVADEKQMKLLGNLADKGNRFVILYN